MKTILYLLEIEIIRWQIVEEFLNEFIVSHGLVDQLRVLFELLRDGFHPQLLVGEILYAVGFVVQATRDGFKLLTRLDIWREHNTT